MVLYNNILFSVVNCEFSPNSQDILLSSTEYMLSSIKLSVELVTCRDTWHY